MQYRVPKVVPWLTVPLAVVALLITLSLMDSGDRMTLLIVTCCMLGVVPVVLFQGYRKDLKERDKTEQALRESEERYRRFLQLTPTPVVLCRKGRIVEANPAWAKLTGTGEAAPSHRKVAEFLDLANRDVVERHLAEAEALGQEKVILEHRIVRADGSKVPVELMAFPARLDGEPAVQLFLHDRSVEKAAEQAMETAKRELRAAETAKTEFLANVSHEIRTPMNAILGFSGLLLSSELESEQRGWLETIRQSADRLLSMFNDVLDVAKLEAGQLALETAPFDLEQAMEGVMDAIEPQAAPKSLHVSLLYGPEVPRGVVGDAGRIRQVVLELARNAVRFTDKGRVLIAVEQERSTPESALLRISVSDTGSGISYEDQRRLFQTFAPGDGSARRRHTGLGVGLALTRRLVERMDGSIGVLSKPGLGSTFHVNLPLPLAPDLDPASRPSRAASVEPDQAVFPGRRVLLVDDNPSNQQLGAALLSRFGARVDVAANGTEAVMLADRLPYDAIFMDCQMPEMDGYEATAEIRRRELGRKRTPIIAMTAHAMETDRRKCLDAGMDDYLGKPVDIGSLRNLLLTLAAK